MKKTTKSNHVYFRGLFGALLGLSSPLTHAAALAKQTPMGHQSPHTATSSGQVVTSKHTPEQERLLWLMTLQSTPLGSLLYLSPEELTQCPDTQSLKAYLASKGITSTPAIYDHEELWEDTREVILQQTQKQSEPIRSNLCIKDITLTVEQIRALVMSYLSHDADTQLAIASSKEFFVQTGWQDIWSPAEKRDPLIAIQRLVMHTRLQQATARTQAQRVIIPTWYVAIRDTQTGSLLSPDEARTVLQKSFLLELYFNGRVKFTPLAKPYELLILAQNVKSTPGQRLPVATVDELKPILNGTSCWVRDIQYQWDKAMSNLSRTPEGKAVITDPLCSGQFLKDRNRILDEQYTEKAQK